MPEKAQFDVIIVGAGPAGATLSYLLARSGADVLLIERDTSFEKEFRGPAYQPVVIQYFDQMEILNEILLVEHSKLYDFSVTDRDETLFTLSLDVLEKPYNFAAAMQQGPFLRKLIQLSSEFPNLTFLGNAPVTDIVTENGMIAGVKCQIEGEEQIISSRLVIAADGRFSTLREASGIDLKKSKEQFDVVWFDLPVADAEEYRLGLEVSREGMIVFIPQEQGHVRLGWVLPKGDYLKLQKGGIENFRKALVAAKPSLKDILPKILTSFDQCSYLDVKIALAEQWTKDGLLLIGDAAHIASPIGAQGNKLAIQDAIAAHPVIMQKLRDHPGIIRSYHLENFVAKRRKEAVKIFRIQKMLGRAVMGIRNPIINKARKIIFPFFQKFIAPKIMKRMTFGYQSLRVEKSWFQYQTDYGKHHRYYLLKVAAKEWETDRAVSFYFEIPEKLKKEFAYKPGQFITLRLLDEGQLHKRCYSLSSVPHEDEHLKITVKRVEDGLISNDMIDKLEVGDEVLILPPAGQFTPQPDASRYVMFAGGSGITPVYSLIRSLLKDPSAVDIRLIYANHDLDSIIFKEAIEHLQKEYSDKFQVIHCISQQQQTGLMGRLDNENIGTILKSCPEEAEYYICGPALMISLVKDALKKRDIPDSQVHIERFTSLAEPFEEIHELVSEKPLIVGDGEEAPSEELKSVLVTLNGRETEISCQPGENILSAAIRQNLNPPFSCREGICSTCTARLKSGKVSMEKHQALSEVEAQEGKILTCQAVPLTKSCKVDYD